jgi:RTX calcium-binding nonapeptide repeat (4 copies)
MATTRTLTSARATQTATLNDTWIATGAYDTLIGDGGNSLVAAANNDYLIARNNANTLVGSTLSSNSTTLQGNGLSTLKYAGANNTFILNSSVSGGSGLDYRTDSIIGSGSALAASSVIQTSLNRFDLSNTANHGDGIKNISRLVYTGVANATLHGNNQNNSIVGGQSANSLSSAGTTGISTLDGHFSKTGNTLEGNGLLSSLIGSSLGDLYKISEAVSGGSVIYSDKIYEGSTGGIDTIQITDATHPILSGSANAKSNTITLATPALTNSARLIGSLITGLGIAPNTKITGISGSTITLSIPTTAAITTTTPLTIDPAGALTTTFNLSDTTLNGNSILNIENLSYGGSQSATLYGNALNNLIKGGSGNNFLQGNGGSDTLDASAETSAGGSNTLVGSSNAPSTLIGGSGTNSFYLYNSSDSITAAANSKNQLFIALPQVDLSSFGNLNISGITYITKGGASSITGGANGHQTINDSGATSAYLSDGGNPTDKLIGSATGPNVFVVSGLGAGADTVVGGTGPGTLITSNVTLSDSAFSSPYLSGVQVLDLLSNARVSLGSYAAAEGISTVIAAPGNDYVDASQFNSNLYINASASTLGNTLIGSFLAPTTLLGGTKNDSLVVNAAQIATDSISGGAGTDTLLISSAATLGDTAFAGISGGIEVLQITSNSSVTLGTNASRAGFATLVAGQGSDIVNASSFSRSLTVDASSNGTSALTYQGSSLNDYLLINASARASSSITGGAGTDTLAIVGTLAGINDSFSNLSSIEVLSLAGGSNSLTLGSGASAAGIKTLVAGSGNDTINAVSFSSTLTVNASASSLGDVIVASSLSSANIQAGSGADFISVSNTKISGDTISGGAGVDTLAITGGSATLSTFGNISGIEVLSLSGGNNKLSTIGSGMTLVAGGASGGDSIDASASSTPIRIDASAATLGDYFVLSSAQIAIDTLAGGSGIDTLQIAGGGAILSNFANITGIDILSLTGGSNRVSNLSSGISLVSGGVSGGDTIDASNSSSPILLDESSSTLGDSLVASATAPSTLLGGSGNDAFSVTAAQLSNDKISGGTGSNTLTVSTSGTLDDSFFSNDTSIQALRITSPTTVTLGSYASAAGISTLITGMGSDTVNAASLASGLTLDASSANTTSVNYTGSSNGDLILIGATALSSSTIAGGGGTDTLSITAAANLADSAFANETSIEVLRLSSPSSVTLAGTASGAGISKVVTGSGSDKVNAASLASALTLDASATNTTSVKYTGSSFGDLVKINSAAIAASTITGGSGIDTLLVGNGNATISALPNVSGMEILSLTGGNNLVNGLARGMSTIAGGTGGGDTIDATAFSTAVTINEIAATLGNTLVASSVTTTTILGGSGSDSLAVTSQRFPSDSFDGGSGSDSLTILNGTAYISNFSGVSNVENLLLSGGHNTLTNLANSGIRVIQGGTLGGDSIDASNSWGDITVNESSSSLGDTLISSSVGGGISSTGYPVKSLLIGSATSGNYFVQTNSSDSDLNGTRILSQATVHGGSGIDTLQIGISGDGVSGQTLADSVFGNGADTSIEVLKLTGSTFVSLASSAYTAGISTVIGGTGNDTIDASSFNLGQASLRGLTMDLTANAGGQSYDTTSGGNDLVIVASSLIAGSNLNHYKINGGAGIDTLQVIGGLSLGSFTNLQSFEVVSLSGSANSLAGMGSSGTRTVIGSAGGKDTIDATTGVNPIYVNAAASSLGDTLTASSVTGVASTLVGSSLGGNMFIAGATATQLAGDSIVGGNGNDTLVLTGSDTFTAASFNKIRSVEVLSLTGSSGTYISLTAAANSAGISSVIGAIGTNDTLDASNFNNGSSSIRGLYFDLSQNASLSGTNSSLAASGGNDLIRLTSGLLNNNFLYTHNDTINGGIGSDTIQISDTLPVSLTNFSPIISVEVLSLAGGNNTLANLGTSSNPALPGSGLAAVIGGSLGGDSVDASTSKVSFLYNGASGLYGDTLTAVNTPTIIGATATYVTSTLIGSQAAGNQFIAPSESALQAASLLGGTGSDTVIYGGNTIKAGDFSKDAGSSLDVLVLNGSGGGDYALFGDAQAAGISQIIDQTAGANTLDASRYNYGSIILDASQTTTYADTLIGGSGTSANTLIGSRAAANSFYLNSSSAVDSVVGNSAAIDTLTFLTGSQVISDNLQGRSVEVLSLTGSANSISLGANAQATGISSVFGGTAGNNSISGAGITKGALWLDASQGVLGSTLAAGGASGVLFSNTTLIGSTNAKASNVFQIGIASLLGNDSIYGSGAGHNLLQVTTAGQTLSDSLFAKMGNLANLDQLSLKGGNNFLQLGTSAAQALSGAALTSTLAGGGLIVTVTGGAGKDTLDLSGFGSQNVLIDGSSSGLGDSIVAGSGHETLLGGATTTANNYFLFTKAALTSPVYASSFDASIVGGNGTNTLELNSSGQILSLSNGNTQLNGRGFSSNVSGIDVLYLNGSSDTLNLNGADAAGITTIVGGSGPSSIDGTNFVSSNQNLYWNFSKSNGGDTLVGGQVGSGNVGNVFQIKNDANLGNTHVTGSLHGGKSVDTLQIVQGAQTIGDGDFSFDSNVGSIVLGSSSLGNSISVGSNASSMTGTSTTLSITAGTARDTVNAANYTQNKLWVNAASGSGDSLIGTTIAGAANTLIGATSGGNTFVLGSVVTGNSIVGAANGQDTLQFSASTNINQTGTTDLAGLSGIGTIEFLAGNNNVNLSLDAAQAGIGTIILGQQGDSVGGDIIDASSGFGSKPITFQITDQNYLEKSVLTGGAGIDTLKYSRDGISMTEVEFANIHKIEVIQTANGNNHFMITGKANASGVQTIMGGSGKDTIDLTDTVVGYTPTRTIAYDLSKGSGYTVISTMDRFYSSGTASTRIIGGTGANTVVITTGGNLNDNAFANQYQAKIGTLDFENPFGNSISCTLGSNALAAGIKTVDLGLYDNGDVIDATGFTGPLTINGQLSPGNSVTWVQPFYDGVQVLTSYAELANLTYNAHPYSLVAGVNLGGNDSLVLVGTNARAITSDSLTGTFDALVLGNGNNFVQLTSANSTGVSSIFGGTGRDTINVQGFTNLQSVDLVVNASNLASDSLRGGIQYVGGRGSDTVSIAIGTQALAGTNVITDANFSRMTDIQAFELDATGGTNLSVGANAAFTGIHTIYGGAGNDTIDASAYPIYAEVWSDGKTIQPWDLNVVVRNTAALTSDTLTGAPTASLNIANDIHSILTISNPSPTIGSAAQRVYDSLFGSYSTLAGYTANNITGFQELDLNQNQNPFDILNGNAVTLGGAAQGEGIQTLNGGSGHTLLTILDASYMSNCSLLGGATEGPAVGYNSITFQTAGQAVSDGSFSNSRDGFGVSNFQILNFTGGGNSIVLDTKAQASGIFQINLGSTAASTLGDTLTQTAGDTTALKILGGINNLYSIATVGQLAVDTITGGGGTNTLNVATGSQTITDGLFVHDNNLTVLTTSGGNNSITMGTNAQTAGIRQIVGGLGNDLIDASAATLQAGMTLDGGNVSSTTGIDTLISGAGSGADAFVLANSGGSYYGRGNTPVAASTGISAVTATSYALIEGFKTTDSLILHTGDTYTIGITASAQPVSSNHFGLYDNGNFVADISAGLGSNFTVQLNDSFTATSGSNHNFKELNYSSV